MVPSHLEQPLGPSEYFLPLPFDWIMMHKIFPVFKPALYNYCRITEENLNMWTNKVVYIKTDNVSNCKKFLYIVVKG